jgi:hypothetical protein
MLSDWLNRSYPRNYILDSPTTGATVISIFCFLFSILYKPLGVHAAQGFSYAITMAFYSIFSGLATWLLIRLVISIKWLGKSNNWTILKEFASILMILTGIGIAIYIIGFFIEAPSQRWNFSTFIDSLIHGSLIGAIPFLFFTLINYPKLQLVNENRNTDIDKTANLQQEKIHISSQLKKESLDFYPDELIYAESDGNYVIFFLERNNQVKKEIIRNSINSIEEQLSGIPFLMRTHRAFIVNLKKVTIRQGTTLGYNLKLSLSESRIPVSRNNTRKFNQLLSDFRN